MSRRLVNPGTLKDFEQVRIFLNELVKTVNLQMTELYAKTNTEINLTSSSLVEVDTTYKAGDRTFILADASVGPFTITLPVPENYYRDIFVVKKTNTNANQVTVQVSGGGTIDGGASVNVSSASPSLLMISDGTEYISF